MSDVSSASGVGAPPHGVSAPGVVAFTCLQGNAHATPRKRENPANIAGFS
ncbi:MAG: hypothetical protein U0704_04305 [Candidatus Eisenbacteria bacterium]